MEASVSNNVDLDGGVATRVVDGASVNLLDRHRVLICRYLGLCVTVVNAALVQDVFAKRGYGGGEIRQEEGNIQEPTIGRETWEARL